MLFNGWQTTESFEAAWNFGFEPTSQQKEAANHYEYKLLNYQFVGSIGSRLSRIVEYLGRERIHIILLDDMRNSPSTEFRNTLKFLGVNTSCELDLSPVHVGIERQSAVLSNLIRRGRLLKYHINFQGSFGLLNILNRINKARNSKTNLDKHLRGALDDYFRPEVELIEHILKRNLDNWKSH
jgi:hypothetical protein